MTPDEIYRRCHNNYGMEKDEIDTLVLKGKDYAAFATDEEKLQAFYDDLLKVNKVSLEDSVDDASKIDEDTRQLDDVDKTKLGEIKKRNRRAKADQIDIDAEAYEAAGAHLEPKDRVSYKDLMESLRDLDLEAPDED